MNIRKKSIRRKVGDVVQVDLGSGFHSYAHVSTDPCIIFYEGKFEEELNLNEIIKLNKLFNLSVSNFAIKDGVWPVIGHSKLSDEDLEKPYRFKQDALIGKLSIYHPEFKDSGYEREATYEECKNLECAAVWNPSHVVDRLNDYYEGRLNKWVEQLSIDKEKIPR